MAICAITRCKKWAVAFILIYNVLVACFFTICVVKNKVWCYGENQLGT